MVSVPLTLASFVFGMLIATAVALVRVMPQGGWLHRIRVGDIEGVYLHYPRHADGGAACYRVLRLARDERVY